MILTTLSGISRVVYRAYRGGQWNKQGWIQREGGSGISRVVYRGRGAVE